MRRFFKSAAFPILLVVILAFIAQRVISSGDGTPSPSYNELINQKSGLIVKGEVEEVDVNTKDNTLDVKLNAKGGEESFSTGYPPDGEKQLVNLLDENNVKTDVHGSGSSSLLSLLTL
ncbi:MAG: ATP-dependent metallopeptidase FtsH/Yme1/Tma family protein, partial [Solirubrobacterales bacterium]